MQPVLPQPEQGLPSAREPVAPQSSSPLADAVPQDVAAPEPSQPVASA